MLAAWVLVYTTIWAATLAAATIVAVAGVPLSAPIRAALDLTLTRAHNRPASVAHTLALAAHNTPIAAWPLLLGLARIENSRRARRAADIVVLACMVVNATPVGAALGAYGTRLIPYIPQLPVEWAGLALGYGSWFVQRRRTVSGQERLRMLGLLILVLVLAAALETYAVPHR